MALQDVFYSGVTVAWGMMLHDLVLNILIQQELRDARQPGVALGMPLQKRRCRKVMLLSTSAAHGTLLAPSQNMLASARCAHRDSPACRLCRRGYLPCRPRRKQATL
eukprot:TRINITY_DN957_c1_g2_i2.p3 TRINITY_DN957_c1_g2~~TRINITY_DN957_c1_g2_i2.p3  ORF type:complete len:107 (-),score=5.38 TRINITY_DN957_c1_g2_i2:92-412(-)